jgi:mannose-6-phosphate isomerase
MSQSRETFERSLRNVRTWLFDDALPLWGSTGIDPSGGFHEKVGQDGIAIDEPRRTRVIARQVYCFAAGARMGWQGDCSRLVAHGFDALKRNCRGPEGLVFATSQADGSPIDLEYDFYDHAFALFGLANIACYSEYREDALRIAHALQDSVDYLFQHGSGGFKEDRTGAATLRANPHMHQLEACLALAQVDPASPRWSTIGDTIVEMAMTRFIDPATGALREFFAPDWRPLSDAEGQVVEPGHQFEWSWLLASWNETRQDAAVSHAVRKLAQIGTAGCIDASGRVIDALNTDLSVRHATYRAWPQCERLKSHLGFAFSETDPSAADQHWDAANAALGSWRSFLATEVPGLWFDRLGADGKALCQPAPASTLYHFVCAIEAADGAIASGTAWAPLRPRALF